MIATLITAHFLVDWGDATRNYYDALWFYLKVGLVGLLVIYHLVCGYYRQKLIAAMRIINHTSFGDSSMKCQRCCYWRL